MKFFDNTFFQKRSSHQQAIYKSNVSMDSILEGRTSRIYFIDDNSLATPGDNLTY